MLNLLVIRVADMAKSLEFYQGLGFSFVKEQHMVGEKPGLVHYSCDINGLIFELYPASNQAIDTSTRLGFKGDFIESIVQDPDGRFIHLSNFDEL